MFSDEDLASLNPSVRPAIVRAAERVDRALQAGDLEATIGGSKELVETVAKVVIHALGGTAASDVDLPKLANQTLQALEMHPSGLEGRRSLQRLSQATISTLCGLAELRNSDGTGHGRPYVSELHIAHGEFAMETARAWSRWVLRVTSRVLQGRQQVIEAAEAIRSRTFFAGDLSTLISDLRVPDLAAEDQRMLGLAVARRWSVSGTFNARNDVIKPLADGTASFPKDFIAGLVEGLVLDHNGYLCHTVENLNYMVQIGLGLTREARTEIFARLAELADDARVYDTINPELESQTEDLAVSFGEDHGEESRELFETLLNIATRRSYVAHESQP